MNCKMPELKRALEKAGFEQVKTVLTSGNAVFEAPAAREGALAREVEAAIEEHLGSSFLTIVRSLSWLEKLLVSEPFSAFKLKPGSKRVVTFLSEAPAALPALPIRLDSAKILAVKGQAVFSTYVPGPRAPVFMALIERTFGKKVTTRTWETVSKVAKAAVAAA